MKTTKKRQLISITVAGGLLPGEFLDGLVIGGKGIPHLESNTFNLSAELSLAEAISDSWNAAVALWRRLKSVQEHSSDELVTQQWVRERWSMPLLGLLGFNSPSYIGSTTCDGTKFAISHVWGNTPIHLVNSDVSLDLKTPGVRGAAKASPFGAMQEFLNQSPDHLWGIVANGLRLRIVRDNVSLVKQAYVEFDFEKMFENELFSEFRLFWLLCHSSRFKAADPSESIIERWSIAARETGVRAREGMRRSLESSLRELGIGFIVHPANAKLRAGLADGRVSPGGFYKQLLRLAYRLIFLFVIEDKGMLAGSPAYKVYERFYSTARLRQLSKRRFGSKHCDLWIQCRKVFSLLQTGCDELGLPALGGDIWSVGVLPDCDSALISNSHLLGAVRALSKIEVDREFQDIDFSNLKSEEMGSVYESLLELEPRIDLSSRRFDLTMPSENERKGTGSYYTPPALVSALLEKSLDVAIANAYKSEAPAHSILSLKVLDPTCGSGHFLTAAAHRLARALSRVRAGDFEAPNDEYRAAYRDVVESCIYGVDINDMAVELCKLSLWIESFVPGLPLTFLDHRIKVGNSVLGITPSKLADGIPSTAFEKKESDDGRRLANLRKRNMQELEGVVQLSFFETADSNEHNVWRNELVALGTADQHSLSGNEKCKSIYSSIQANPYYQHQKLAADAWCAAFFWRHSADEPDCPTTSLVNAIKSSGVVAPAVADKIQMLASDGRFFHWYLEYADVFDVSGEALRRSNRDAGWSGGFDVIVGNPPYGNAIEANTSRSEGERRIYKELYPEVAVGAYDKVNLFLHHSVVNLLKPGGFYAFLQPRTNLSSTGALHLQEVINREAPPQFIISPDDSHMFAPAIVFIAGIVGRKVAASKEHSCQISTSADCRALEFRSQRLTVPWWTMLSEAPVIVCSSKDSMRPFGTIVSIGAGCTTGAAYELKPLIVDSEHGEGLKLTTTGLIDRYVVSWGRSKVRFLKSDFDFPRWPLNSQSVPAGVRRAIEAQECPKVLVAGLVNRIESFFDLHGEYGGVVSTYVLKPISEEIELRLIAAVTNSWLFSYEYLRLYGAKEIGGGGYWSIGKKELQSIHVMVELFTNDQYRAQLLELLNDYGAPVNDDEFQYLLCRLVGLAKDDIADLKKWYFNVKAAEEPRQEAAPVGT